MTVRVRFAPSPTGHLHIGGARTALYNWLFAKQQGGTFILRIEDTDTERSTDEYIHSILEGMKWLGLTWDEGPYRQMERLETYRQLAFQLLEEGKAYKCYCTAAELEAKREAALKSGQKPKYDGTCRHRTAAPSADAPFVIRIKVPETGTTVVNDIVRGTIPFENKELDDLIIFRSNGTPTYNFTVVVDDVTMNITHVIRGDDHINNTPRQIIIYNALNYPVPLFAHLPMILGSDKQRLSKRHGATSVLAYRDMGYLPEGLLNYLVRLGWSHGDQEIFTLDELSRAFNLDSVGSSPAVFDSEKLNWVNAQHLKKLSNEELAEATLPFLSELGLTVTLTPESIRAITSEREKARTLQDLATATAFFFRKTITINPDDGVKWLGADGIAILTRLKDDIAQLSELNHDSIKALFDALMAEKGLKMVKLAQPCRVALTGTTASPGIYETISMLGKETTIARFEAAIREYGETA